MSSRASLRLLVVSCGVLAAGFIGWLTWSYVASEKERKNKPKLKPTGTDTIRPPGHGPPPLPRRPVPRKPAPRRPNRTRSTRRPSTLSIPEGLQGLVTIQAAFYGVMGVSRTTRKAKKRKNNKIGLEREIVQAEKTYVKNLKILQERFKKPLEKLFDSKKKWDKSDCVKMFNNLDSIVSLHENVLRELMEGENKGWGTGGRPKGPAAILHKYSDFFRLYAEYLIHYDRAIDLIKIYQKNHKSFRNLLEKCRNGTPGADRGSPEGKIQSIASYLIMPCQRIPRYELLLEGLKKNSWPEQDPVAYRLVVEAHVRARAVAMKNEKTQKISEDLAFISKLQERISRLPLPLFSSSRKLLKDSNLSLTVPPGTSGVQFNPESGDLPSSSSTQLVINGYTIKVHIYLFTDLILWTDLQDRWMGAGSVQGVVIEQDSIFKESGVEGTKSFRIKFAKFWHRPPEKKQGKFSRTFVKSTGWSPFSPKQKKSRARTTTYANILTNNPLSVDAKIGLGGTVTPAVDVWVTVDASSPREAVEWINGLKGAALELETAESSRRSAARRGSKTEAGVGMPGVTSSSSSSIDVLFST